MTAILIVDDNADNLYLLDVLLKNKGFQVHTARDGSQALSMAREMPPGLIISDILMPGMDGFSFCRAVKADDDLRHIPFVFYTATYTDEKDEAYALALGADRFIRKPMQPDLFIAQIEQVIRDQEAALTAADSPPLMAEDESYKLYSERLVKKLEKKMFDLEAEIERRQALEEDLRRARNEWEETFQAIASPALMLDAEFNILHANRAAVSKLQTTENDLIDKKCYQVFHRTDEPHLRCPLEQVLKSDNDQGVETEIDALGGTYLLNCAPLKSANGRIEKIIHVMVDITERKRIEAQLKASEEKFLQLVENINELFWIRDARSDAILYVSPTIEKIFGIKREAIRFGLRQFMEIVHEEDRERIKASHLAQIQAGQTTDITYRIRKGDDIRWLRAKAFPIRDSQGKVVKIAGVTEDITEAKEAEDRRKKLENQLIQAQKLEAIGTLAGGIAHDFNNILSSIIGYTELSMEGQERESDLSDNLGEVMAAGMRAKELVQQILTLARKSDEEFKPVQVSTIAKEALKMMRATIPTNIEVSRQLDSDALVLAPPGQIHQVIVNLMTNAAHAMRADGGVLEVRVTDEVLQECPTDNPIEFNPGRYLKMTITDTGEGIPEGNLTEIFNPYFTTKKVGEGSGLGLSVTHGIVKKCGGLISAQSRPGEGSRFTVYLPALQKTASEGRPDPQRLPTGSEHILIVDDEAAIARMTAQRLERLGYTVTAVTSSLAALDRFKNQPGAYDLVLTDMTMPHLMGDQLAAAILGLRPDIPIILCTGFSSRMSAAAASAKGIKAHLMKPLTVDELAHTVRRVLDEGP